MTGRDFLEGIVDIHLHTRPDVRERRYDDMELARVAASFGARAIVIKSHVEPTVSRAHIVNKEIDDLQVYGGITLNPHVGGLNPKGVESAIKMGARIVWLPTSFSYNARKQKGFEDGIKIVDEKGLKDEAKKIIDLIAHADIALGTGHVSVEEVFAAVEYAVEAGVKKIIINHPEKKNAYISLEDQKKLAEYEGVFFERCYSERKNGKYEVNFESNLEAINEIGYESTIIATDGGQVENPKWDEMFDNYLTYLLENDISENQIRRMCMVNPSYVIGI